MKTYQLELFADYFQFYFQDDNPDYGDLSEAWTEDATNQLMAISDRVVGVGTSRDTDVQVYVAIINQILELYKSQWGRNRSQSLDFPIARSPYFKILSKERSLILG